MLGIASRIEKPFGFQQPLVWRNAIGIAALQIALVYSLVVYVGYDRKFLAASCTYAYGFITGISVTIGAHRLWTHKTYKATLPLRIWIMLCYMGTGMYGIVQWARDHRTHHKFTDTDADPHNSKRGFFFSHCGWLMMKRHPDVKEKGKTIDVSDILEDPVVRFSEKYFVPLLILNHTLLPVLVGHYIFKEPWTVCIVGMVMARYAIMLHIVWLVNSWAHFFGSKPYNKNIRAVDSKFAAFITMGEAWHNFHHTFPWDYRIGEYGRGWQIGSNVIEFYAWLGLAYDLKTAPVDMIQRVLEKNGELGVNEEMPEVEINCNIVKKDFNVKNGKVKAW